MKSLIIAVALLAISVTATAQTSTATSGSSSNAQQAVDASNAGNQLGVQQNYYSNADGAQHYSGQAKILSNPGVILGGAAAGFSNNNCANSAQGGVSTLWGSIGAGGPKESKACNHRQNASTFYAAAGEEDRVGSHDRAAALRSMGVLQACRAAAAIDPADMDNCKLLGLVVDKNAPAVAAAQAPSSIPSRPAGWTNEHYLRDKRLAPRADAPSEPQRPQ